MQREDWFPHPSPDGKRIAYLSFDPGTKGHPANQKVKLQLMNAKTRKSEVLKDLFGGQGTLNVNSWAPDSAALLTFATNCADPQCLNCRGERVGRGA